VVEEGEEGRFRACGGYLEVELGEEVGKGGNVAFLVCRREVDDGLSVEEWDGGWLAYDGESKVSSRRVVGWS
jgi:hypothetical protein